MELKHIKYQASQLIVDDFTAMSPSLLHEVVDAKRVVDVHEVDFFGIVEYLEEARSDYISVERQSRIFPEEIIITANEWGD